jgi:methionine aminopeptidase
VALCVDGADIYTVCQTVDAFIEAEVQKTFQNKKAKKMERGIAFPTCVSVNQIMGHYSPLVDESTPLKAGDVAKM